MTVLVVVDCRNDEFNLVNTKQSQCESIEIYLVLYPSERNGFWKTSRSLLARKTFAAIDWLVARRRRSVRFNGFHAFPFRFCVYWLFSDTRWQERKVSESQSGFNILEIWIRVNSEFSPMKIKAQRKAEITIENVYPSKRKSRQKVW